MFNGWPVTSPPGVEQVTVLPAGITPRLLIFAVAELQAVVRVHRSFACADARRVGDRDVVVPCPTELDDSEEEEDEEREDERKFDE